MYMEENKNRAIRISDRVYNFLISKTRANLSINSVLEEVLEDKLVKHERNDNETNVRGKRK